MHKTFPSVHPLDPFHNQFTTALPNIVTKMLDV